MYSNKKYHDSCWICDSWQETPFSYLIEPGAESMVESCYVHLSFEDWKAVELQLNPERTAFQIKRMCPRERVYFFFTVNRVQLFDSSQLYEEREDPIIKNIQIGNKFYE